MLKLFKNQKYERKEEHQIHFCYVLDKNTEKKYRVRRVLAEKTRNDVYELELSQYIEEIHIPKSLLFYAYRGIF